MRKMSTLWFLMTLGMAAGCSMSHPKTAQEGGQGSATPGYNNKIPESIMTPDEVKTRIGTLKFFSMTTS